MCNISGGLPFGKMCDIVYITLCHYFFFLLMRPKSWGHSGDLDPSVVRLLLDRGADPNLQANTGLSPLHRASEYGKIEMVRLLVERGASVEAQDEEGRTPFDVASGEHRDEIIKLLLERRAK